MTVVYCVMTRSIVAEVAMCSDARFMIHWLYSNIIFCPQFSACVRLASAVSRKLLTLFHLAYLHAVMFRRQVGGLELLFLHTAGFPQLRVGGCMSHSTKPATMEATSSLRCDFQNYQMSAGGI